MWKCLGKCLRAGWDGAVTGGTSVGTEGKCALRFHGGGFAVVPALGRDVRALCDSSSCSTSEEGRMHRAYLVTSQ